MALCLIMPLPVQDPSVMSAALCALHESVKQDSLPYKNLIPSFISILKQVSSSRAGLQVYGSCVPSVYAKAHSKA